MVAAALIMAGCSSASPSASPPAGTQPAATAAPTTPPASIAATIPTAPRPKAPARATATTGTTPAPATTTRTTTRTPTSVAGSAPMVVRTGVGYDASGLEGPSYASETCRAVAVVYRGVANVAPDPRCTPGAVNVAVTQADLDQTICRSGGYTATIRAPESMTNKAKYLSMTAYGYTGSAHPYEFDHLIPLELGGSNNTANLWPERDIGGSGGFIINAKDALENRLHAAVCSGLVGLTAAQDAIATNWATAGARLGLAAGT